MTDLLSGSKIISLQPTETHSLLTIRPQCSTRAVLKSSPASQIEGTHLLVLTFASMLETTKCELVRLTRLLASAVDLSGFAYRSVELSLGWSSGSMSQLMAGKVELKVRHVLQICEVIGFPPA